MTIRLGLISWATGTLMLVAVSACGGSDTDPPPTSEPSSTAPSSTTTSASPSSPSDAASDAATEAVRSYFTVVDQLRSDPAADLKELKSAATSAQLNAVETLIRRQRG